MQFVEKEKEYEFIAKNGSKVKVEIKTEIKNLNKNDLQEILSEFAIRTRDFYLGLGNEINNKP